MQQYEIGTGPGQDPRVDQEGEKKAVLIDLKRNRDLWEGFYDSVLALEREGDSRERLEALGDDPRPSRTRKLKGLPRVCGGCVLAIIASYTTSMMVRTRSMCWSYGIEAKPTAIPRSLTRSNPSR